MTYGFIGLGLIGGSIAKALKAGEPDCQIYAYMPSREMLEEARADGTVDRILTGTEPCLADCDAVFLCAPVETNSSYLAALRDILPADTLITDVGSSKQSIEREVLRLGLGAQFVGGKHLLSALPDRRDAPGDAQANGSARTPYACEPVCD